MFLNDNVFLEKCEKALFTDNSMIYHKGNVQMYLNSKNHRTTLFCFFSTLPRHVNEVSYQYHITP